MITGQRVSVWVRSWRAALAATLVAFGCSDDAPAPAPVHQGPNLPPLERPCDSDEECPSGRCDPLKGCVACLFDWDCEEGEGCSDGACRPVVSCETDADCSAASGVCDRLARECVACLDDLDCPENSRCKEQQCLAFVPCVNSLDCPSGLVCQRDRGECVGCVTDSDCPEERTCQGDSCVPRCESDKECQPLGLLCGPGGFCVQCVEPVDCPSVYHCTAEGRCKLDVCEPTRTTCDPLSLGVVSCNAEGSEASLSFCGARQSCTSFGTGAFCATWICEPGQPRCNAFDNSVEICADDGLSIVETEPCQADQVCLAGECVDKVCEPLTTFCRDGDSHACSADGTSSTLLRTCVASEYCAANSGNCLPDVCTPEQPICEGDLVTLCNAEGSGFDVTSIDCTEMDQVCWQGSCAPRICEPDSYVCQNGDSYVCTNNGTARQLSEDCPSNRYCNLQSGRCAPDVCSALAPLCDGEVATVCNADGSGPQPGGTDCSASGQACWAGQCRPIVCNTTYFCSGNAAYTCAQNGTAGALRVSCSAGQHCVAQTGSCAANLCTPNLPACNGSVATTCNAFGDGYVEGGTDCATDGQACVSGVCLPLICDPDSYFCQDGNVMRCGPEGATSVLFDVCLASEYCTPGDSSCNPDVCTAAAAVCDGDTLTTCKADGSGPEPGGTDCTESGQVCDQGACRDVICTPNEYFCSEGNVRLCNFKGWASTLADACTAAEFCLEDRDPPVCWWDICTPNAPGCDGEVLATCNAEGSGFTMQSTDCSSTGMVCDLALGCVASAVDTVGSPISTLSVSSDLVGEFFVAHKDRVLTQIEAYASVTGTSIFNWVVYEAPNLNSPYTKVLQVTNTSSGSAVYHSSGTLDFDLVEGKFYFVGVHVTGTFTLYRESANPIRPVSFGQVTGALHSTAEAVPTTLAFSTAVTYTYPIRLTTSAP